MPKIISTIVDNVFPPHGSFGYMPKIISTIVDDLERLLKV